MFCGGNIYDANAIRRLLLYEVIFLPPELPALDQAVQRIGFGLRGCSSANRVTLLIVEAVLAPRTDDGGRHLLLICLLHDPLDELSTVPLPLVRRRRAEPDDVPALRAGAWRYVLEDS